MTALLFTTEPTVAPVSRFISVAEAVTEAIPATGNPVQFVSVPLLGVPSAGVTKAGLVANTRAPEPVSSDTAAATEELVVKAFCLVAIATEIAVNSVSKSTPLIIFAGVPVERASLAVKLVVLV